jgi:lysophospholipase L1-like esterase
MPLYFSQRGGPGIISTIVGPQGEQGEPGDDGPTLTPMGPYSPSDTYTIGNVVNYEGSSWIYWNPESDLGNEPPSLPTMSNDYWMINASKGDDGADGDTTDTLLDAAIRYQRADEHNWPLVPSKSFVAVPEKDVPTGLTYARTTAQYNRGPDLVWRAAAIDTIGHAYDVDGSYMGWPIFSTATNLIENNTGQGVVAGSTGTAPTNYGSVSTGFGGTVRTIGAATTEDGIAAWDVQYAASPTTSATSGLVGMATSMQIAAVQGDNFVFSTFLKLQAGTRTGMTFYLRLSERDGAGAALTSHDLEIEPTDERLGSQRFVLQAEMTHASCAYVIPQIVMVCADATAVDYTLRIGWSQLETGLRETPPIPTTSATVVRGSDVLTCTSLGDWFNPTEFMVRIRAYVTRMRAAVEPLLQIDDNTADNYFRFYINGSNSLAFQVMDTSVEQHDGSTSETLSPGYREFIFCARAKDSDFSQCAMGGKVSNQGDSGTMPTVNRFRIGRTTSSSNTFRGYFKELDFFAIGSSGPSDNIEAVLSAPDTIKGRKRKMVMLGDSIHDTYMVPESVAALTGMKVINGAFAGTRLSSNFADTDPLCGWAIAQAIATGDWDDAIAAADAEVGSRPYWPEKIRRLAAQNWNLVDIITFAHGTNDWSGEADIGTSVDTDETTLMGTVNMIIEDVLTAYPHLRIMFISPMFRTSGSNGNGDTMLDFVDAIIDRCEAHQTPVLDMYRKLGVNEFNEANWLTDGLHPTSKGVRLQAQAIAGFVTAGGAYR